MNLFWLVLIKGYTTAAGLIIAIGAQNAFILRQGLLRSHVFVLAVLASIIDGAMIILGVSGLGVIINSHVYLMFIAKYGGVLFLFLYGCKCFYSALFRSTTMCDEELKAKRSLKLTILTLLAVSFLNPHMYLDTILIIGTIGAQFEESQRIYFIIGAILASITWFFTLSYGAGLLVPIFQKPMAWKILDSIIGVCMWAISYSIFYM